MSRDLCGRVSRDTRDAARRLLAIARPEPGSAFVLGLSTSELVGENIGSSWDTGLAAAVIDPLRGILADAGVHLAVQCCEHLNRCLVVDEDCFRSLGLREVSVIPRPGAGGAGAAYAFDSTRSPRVVEEIEGHLGMDIGDTFIGMHLRPVVVPVRLDVREVGAARLTVARTRPPLVGGERAEYPPDPAKECPGSSRSC